MEELQSSNTGEMVWVPKLKLEVSFEAEVTWSETPDPRVQNAAVVFKSPDSRVPLETPAEGLGCK